MTHIIHLKSVAEAHLALGLEKPGHPLVSVFCHDCVNMNFGDASFSADMYLISMKDGISARMDYGRSSYDFEEGAVIFDSPGQVVTPVKTETADGQGWSLLFHPDIIRKSELGKNIGNYSFFSYDVNEALHLSDEEKKILGDLANKIQEEIAQNTDRHTRHLIVANIQLLLDYCVRYYDRQFHTRTNMNRDLIFRFEKLLKDYFRSEKLPELGIPTVKYCGRELGISPNYLSDLLRKETGRNAREHIHFFVIDLAKTQLLGSDRQISQIAYDLGFEYPPHFTKLFKKKTGVSPSVFRNLN